MKIDAELLATLRGIVEAGKKDRTEPHMVVGDKMTRASAQFLNTARAHLVPMAEMLLELITCRECGGNGDKETTIPGSGERKWIDGGCPGCGGSGVTDPAKEMK